MEGCGSGPLSGTPILNRPNELVTQLSCSAASKSSGGYFQFRKTILSGDEVRLLASTPGALTTCRS